MTDVTVLLNWPPNDVQPGWEGSHWAVSPSHALAHSSWLPEAHAKTANAFRESPSALPMPIARCLMTPDSTPRSPQPVEDHQGPASPERQVGQHLAAQRREHERMPRAAAAHDDPPLADEHAGL